MGVPIMAVPTNVKRVPKERDYDNITITLENCILPSEKIDETPSMKDGLDRDTENDLRMFGCELIQTAGLLLKLPQVAMATGQVLLQRFYYSRSLVKHEVEVSAMAAIFLAAKIEESPRRIRDIINVYEHVKQTMLKKSQDSLEKLPRLIEVINKRPHTPMDYMSNHYYNLKNAIIKAERVILKVLGFCVHVKHPHKIIITYLQILEHEKNAALARKAWNYMNDSLRTDVFVRFSPEIIACACIFLAARSLKINLPMRPPWWELFDALYDDIEDIALSILRLYSKPRSKITRLEAQVNKIKKTLQEKKQQESKETESTNGSFTPSHNSTISGETQPAVLNNNNSSKPSSKKNSPAEKEAEKRPVLSSVISSSKRNNDRKRGSYKSNRNQGRSESDESSDDSSDSEAELPSKKYAQQRKQYERKKRSPSSDSGNDRRTIPLKISRSDSPVDRKNKSSKDVKSSSYKESNGHYKTSYTKQKRRSRSRSPVKRGRLASPNRKDKYLKEKSREKIRSKDKYVSSKIRR